MPEISIIVPVYKAEQYIRRCLDSIIAQAFTDWECLLIDDGSPDASGKICDEYAGKDCRFRVFHKENGGVGSARQLGVDEAVGVYSIHIDPDDWVESTMLEEMHACIKREDADLLLANQYYCSKDGTAFYRQNYVIDRPSYLLSLILRGNLMGVLWNKLIRHSLYRKYNVRFVPGLNFCEDVLVCAQILIHGEVKVRYLNKPFYHYITDNQISICNRYSPQKFEQRLMSCRELDALITDGELRKDLVYYNYNVYAEARVKGVLSGKELRSFMLDNPILFISLKAGKKHLIRRLLLFVGIKI